MARASCTGDLRSKDGVWKAVTALQRAGELELQVYRRCLLHCLRHAQSAAANPGDLTACTMQVSGIRPCGREDQPGLVEVVCQGRLLLPPYSGQQARAAGMFSAVHVLMQHICSLEAQQEASDASADTNVEGAACIGHPRTTVACMHVLKKAVPDCRHGRRGGNIGSPGQC